MRKAGIIGRTPIMALSSADTIMAMAEQYPLTITAEAKDNYAEIRISGIIHQYQNSAAEFKAKVDEILAQGIKNLKLYLNGPGGSVFEANEIINELKRFEGTKNGSGGALVASAYTRIAIECDSFEMPENGQFMYHKPMGHVQGNEDALASHLKLLQNLTSDYKTSYAGKTGKSEEDIEAAWSKGDVWLTAKEAKEQGFITSISGTKQKITEAEKALFVACGAPTIPQLKTQKTDMKNREQIIAKLKLPKDATDEQIEAAIDASLEKAGQAADIKAQADLQLKSDVEAFIDESISKKKITADVRDVYVSMGMANFDNLKKAVNALPEVKKPELDGVAAEAGREKWTLEDYLEKDPVALDTMAEKEPAKFEALNKAYYGI